MARLLSLFRLLAFLTGACFAFPLGGQAENVTFGYDQDGNQISQQTAIAAPPVILGSPTSKVVAAGTTGGFSVIALSSLPLTYQWYFERGAISGATADSLLLTNVSAANEGSYFVVVSNSMGSVQSGTYRLGVDTNGNGLPDSWEMAYFGNLNQAAGGDFDGDGISNLDEFLNGTDPAVREIYYWNVPSGDFNTPTNWIRYNTPGVPPRAPGAGDIAVISQGTFTLPTNTILAVSQVTVNVSFTAPADTDFTLNVSGNWTFNSNFTLTTGRQFLVTGGGAVNVAGTTVLNGANLVAENSSRLNLPAVTSYTVPEGANVQWVAQRNGSLLSFPNLTTIVGPVTPNTYLTLIVRYDNDPGPTLSLPALSTITKADDGDIYYDSGVSFVADGSGTISAPNLSIFYDNDSRPNSSLTAYGSGLLALPSLLAPKGVNINLNALSHPEQFTSLVGTRFLTVNAGNVVMSNLDSITGLSSIVIENGAQVSFPNVSSYAVPADASVQWIAQRNDSLLSFPNLATIAGPGTPNTYLTLIVRYDNEPGPTLSLPALTTITKADDGDIYYDSGVSFVADGSGTISAPNLSIFHDNDSRPNSSLLAYGSGLLTFPILLAPKGVNINLNAPSHPEQFTSLVGTRSVTINGGSVVMSNLDSIAALISIVIENGAQVSFPNVSSYAVPADASVQWIAQRNGSLLSFPNLITIAGPATPNTYLSLIVRYDNSPGPTLSLPALTTITKADDGDIYYDSGVSFVADGSGTISAPNLSNFNDNDSRPNSSLTAYGSGLLALPSLLAPKGVNINLNALSRPEQFTSLVGTRNFELNNGTVEITNLSSLAGLTTITASGGGKLTFHNVASYTQPADLSVVWRATGIGAELTFANLVSITGNTSPGFYLDLIAEYGGRLNFPMLETITKPSDGDHFANSGIRLYAYGNSATLWAPLLYSFQDNDSHPNSLLSASDTGIMILPSLAQSGVIGVTLNGVILPPSIVPIPTVSSITMVGSNIRITVSSLTGHTYQLQQTQALPSIDWQNVGPSQAGTGGMLQFEAPVQGTKKFYRVKITPWP